MNRHLALPLLSITALAALAPGQEKYWVAASGGVAQIDASGYRWQLGPPSSGRDVAVAPDGKIWMVAAGITVLNADGTPFTVITPAPGLSPFAIAFDKNGHAWASGGNQVEEYDASGVSQGATMLPNSAALGICVDADGNKWIAHRIGPPGVLSRIDAVTGAVSSHPLPSTSLILPIMPFADARGLFNSSHIWVVGDNRGAGELVEFDASGTVLNTIVLGLSSRLQWLSGDCDSTGVIRYMWVGDWGNGDLHKVDVSTGAFTTYPQGVGVGGVTFDGFGNLWITLRGVGIIRRIDQATGNTEIETTPGASNQISTRWQYASVVDPLGDIDGDGNLNLFEVTGGSSPFAACSLPNSSLSVDGSPHIGATATVAMQADATAVSLVAFSGGIISPSLPLPGFGCAIQIDPANILGSFLVIGAGGVTLPIPNVPSLVGLRLQSQAANLTALTFTNVAPILVW